MQILVCERCGDEVEAGDLNNFGLCPDCAEEEERLRLLGKPDGEDEDEDEASPESS